MADPNITLRISGGLRDYLDECTGKQGVYETPSEYLRDLIRRDMAQKEAEKSQRLRAALMEGLSAKSTDYKILSASTVKNVHDNVII